MHVVLDSVEAIFNHKRIRKEECLMAQVVENLETESTEQEQFSYVVHGAIISCEHGSHLNYLNLPQDHGVYIKGKAVMNVGDRNPENIPTFGVCLQLKKNLVRQYVPLIGWKGWKMSMSKGSKRY